MTTHRLAIYIACRRSDLIASRVDIRSTASCSSHCTASMQRVSEIVQRAFASAPLVVLACGGQAAVCRRSAHLHT